jgi:aryl-alcohol dehydrogenase-like predicted oxidoreductase
MIDHPYGRRTGLRVSALGFGAGQIGDPALDEAEVGRLLNTALDLGITLVDTARSYGLSEERIGRHLAHRRSEFVLSTKLGYGISGVPDWTGPAVTAGVDDALRRLCTDVIDVVHLHSCDLATLQRGEVIDALQRAQQAGKLRVAAYSGDNAPLQWAVQSGQFGAVECSFNLFDMAALPSLRAAEQAGLGRIAKRPLGNAPWRFAERPVGDYAETYWQRLQQLAYDSAGLPWDALALRFAAYAPEAGCAIAGTSRLAHLKHNVALVEQGPLAPALAQALRARYAAVGRDWPGEI